MQASASAGDPGHTHRVTTPLHDRLSAAATTIAERTGRTSHDVVIVLGSGLGSYPDTLTAAVRIPYAEIPGFPRPAVQGHAGVLVSTVVGANRVLLLAGRAHAYEGHGLDDVTFPVRAAVAAGCRSVVLTNAAGGLGAGLAPGDLVLIRDHLNLTGVNPLAGPNDDRLGPRFPDLTDLYSAELRRLAGEVATDVGVPLREAVYAWFLGPSFETPAEIRMAGILGAGLVGMSTVPEAIAAHHMGARVLGISLVTNLAAGISPTPLSHADVTAAADAARDRVTRLLDALLARLP